MWWILTFIVVLTIAGLIYWPSFSGTRGAERIEVPRQAPILKPDPRPWQSFLDKVRDSSGKVRYPLALGEAKKELDAFVTQIAEATPAQFSNDADRLAFYINAYNALIIHGVLEYWPIQSVEDVGALHLFFRQRKYRVAGQWVSFHGFETRVIRNYDPRMHFALNCASASCPPLAGDAFLGERLDQQLAEVTAACINDPRFNRYDAQARTWYLSKIFEWYMDDFGGEAGVRRLLRTHSTTAWPKDAQLAFLDYDWALNLSSEP